jgi:gluconate 2-dehydrogenase gamma chain
MACETEKSTEYSLSNTQVNVVLMVQNFLFPKDDQGPSAYEISAHQYLQWVLLSEGIDPEDKNYIIKGLEWVKETSIEETGNSFLGLEQNQQHKLLDSIVTTSWGASWCSLMLNFIFEALFCDPIYGGNVNEAGWHWLNHNPGQPRPTEELSLDHFLKFVQTNNT